MVRLAKESDFPFLKEAWQTCFTDSPAFVDWNFSQNFSLSDTVVAEAEGRPASNMQLMPHRIRLRGRDYAVNYVSGVATLPEFRRRGLVRALFAFAFPEMRRRGQPISLLVPFSYPFYEKFGYKQCYTKVYRYAATPPETGTRLGAAALSPGLFARLDSLYRQAMAGRTGYVLRTPETWRRILEDLLLLSQGEVWLGEGGYALASPRPQTGDWELHEVCGPCPVPCQTEVRPFAMARILDPQRVLADMARDFSGSLRLRITDPNLPENNLTLQIGQGRAVPCDSWDFQLDIGLLAQLIFGFAEDVTGSGLFSRTEPYLNMIF